MIDNYDDWKLQTPNEEPEHTCSVCDKPVKKEGDYCSIKCYLADNNDD